MRAVADAQSIECVANGDPSCLGTLFERHNRGVYQYCRQLTRVYGDSDFNSSAPLYMGTVTLTLRLRPRLAISQASACQRFKIFDKAVRAGWASATGVPT